MKNYELDFKSKSFDFTILIVWTVLSLLFVLYHEPWRDELQSFLLAKYLSPIELYRHMRYEGHFMLWFLLIKPLSGVPVEYQNLISWLLVFVSLIPLIFFSPFNKITRIAIVFSAPLLLWYPLMARCYSLIPIIFFGTAMIYPKRFEHPVIYGLIIAAMANIHAYLEGLILAVFLMSCYDFIHYKDNRKQTVVSMLLILAGVGCAFFTVVQAVFVKDGSFHASHSSFISTVFSFINESYCSYFFGTTTLSKYQGALVALASIPLFCCLFNKYKIKLGSIQIKVCSIYVAVSLIFFLVFAFSRKIHLFNDYIFLLNAAMLTVFLLAQKRIFFWTCFTLAVVYQLLIAKYLHSTLTIRAHSVFLIFVFFAWVFYLRQKETPFRENKVKASEKYYLKPVQNMIVMYSFLIFWGSAALFMIDLENSFSGTAKCGEQLRALTKQMGGISTAIYPLDDRLTGVVAYTGEPVFDLEHQMYLRFAPRRASFKENKSLKEIVTQAGVEQDVIIFNRRKMPPQITIKGVLFVKIGQSNAIAYDEVCAIYMKAEKLKTLNSMRKNVQ